jgi:hypothetical protein
MGRASHGNGMYRYLLAITWVCTFKVVFASFQWGTNYCHLPARLEMYCLIEDFENTVVPYRPQGPPYISIDVHEIKYLCSLVFVLLGRE